MKTSEGAAILAGVARKLSQLNLFGEDLRREEPRPATVSPEMIHLAKTIDRRLYLGTCSWAFPGWSGIVYDQAAAKTTLSREGLKAYSRHPLLRCVGLDRTFYTLLGPEAYRDYYHQVPRDFRFIVKAHQDCTVPFFPHSGFFGRDRAGKQNELFLDASFAGDFLVAPFAEGLAEKGAFLLFQFPPVGPDVARKPGDFAERLHRFLRLLPGNASYAVELRNRSLLTPDYFAALRDTGAAHCYNVHPRMPGVRKQRELAGKPGTDILVRWMLGGNSTYEDARERHSPFNRLVDEDPAARAEIAGICREGLGRGLAVYALANNKAEGSAPLSLFKLAEQLPGS